MNLRKKLVVMTRGQSDVVPVGTVKFMETVSNMQILIDISLNGMKQKGSAYLLCMNEDEPIYEFEVSLEERIRKEITTKHILDLSKHIVCGLVVVSNDASVYVASVGGANGKAWYYDHFKDHCQKKLGMGGKTQQEKMAIHETETFNEKPKYQTDLETQSQRTKSSKTVENKDSSFYDEAVACENYYDEAYETTLRVRSAEKFYTDFEPSVVNYDAYRLKNKPSILSEDTVEKVSKISKIIDVAEKEQEKKPKIEEEAKVANNEKSFYATISDQIMKLFSEYPSEAKLEALIEDSSFVKINYGEGKDYYTIGVIFDKQRPAYICYGIPAMYTENPPKEFDGYCEWFPLDENKQEGEGYWMMYQDADSGKSLGITRR